MKPLITQISPKLGGYSQKVILSAQFIVQAIQPPEQIISRKSKV
ncbi:MAG: hypothetical protein Q7W45_11030 [Bacteroidota bacterium]|nr:hypothetical protein [Bacteroidota bacterium]MDP3147143.1 hypothetical protein [Bacteroidota bacterium]